VTLVPYVASLCRLEPDVTLAAGLPPLARLHLLAGFAALAVLPFTALSAPLARAGAAALAAAGRLRPRPAAEESADDQPAGEGAA
jgi:nitrate reductase gamma subunit